MKRWICWGVVTGCGASALFAGNGAWNVDSDGAWSNSANWVGSAVASGAGSTSYFTNYVTARRTVTIDQPVTLEALRFGSPTNNNWRLIGDGPITLEGVAKPRLGSSVNQKVEIFTPLVGTNGFIQENLPGDIELSGNNSRVLGLGDLRANTVVQTMSKTADDASSLARNYFPTSGVIMSGARLELLGRKNGSAASSPWVLTVGSSAVQSTSSSATSSLAPGQTVSGTGLPAGTFIRQILDGSNLVLSAAADQSVTSTLAFAAASFRSEQLLQRVRTDGAQTFRVSKNGGSSFTVAVERVYGTANWALKDGDGVVTIPGQREHRGSIQLHSVDLTLAPKSVSRLPAPNAAFHVDASLAGSLTVVSENKVAEWRDADGKSLWAKMPTTATNGWPTLMSNELSGKPVVDFGVYGVSPYMHWFTAEGRVQLTNIYAVFWVLGSQNGGGFLLGGVTNAHFHRGNHHAGVGSDVFEPVMTSSYMWEHDWTAYPGEGRVETYIDGIKRDRLAALNGGYQLISCMITTNCTAAGFATDRDSFSGRRGGQRLAEVLIYERPLTELERIQTEEYLTAKWLGEARWDLDGKEPSVNNLNALGTRVLNAPDTGLTTLKRLSGSGKLTKNGAGTLVVSDAQDYLGTLAVAGGSLKIEAAAIPVAPASNAYFHVDASLTNTFVFDGNGRVAAWQDGRGNGRQAMTMDGFAAPSLSMGAVGGKPVVDFGALGSLQALQWNHTNTAIKAAFVVIHSLGATSSILGAVTNQPLDFYRGTGGQLYNNDLTGSRAVTYGANYVNGWSVEPLTATLPSGLCVVSVIPTLDARACAFAMDRHYTARSGGQRLAEVIIYNRTLTDQERRDTEAYLMRKWLNRAAPGYGYEGTTLLPSVSFSGSSMNVEVAGAGVATIGQMTGYGRIVKSGAGTLAFGNDVGASGGDILISSGTVSAVTSGNSAPADFPVFHVDASRTNTFTIVQENGTNFITRWASIGAVSNAAVERAGYKRPIILTNDLAGLPTVDFGSYGTYNACMRWETSVSTIRSVFLVLGSQEGGGFLLGSTGFAHFHRGPGSLGLNPVTTNNPMFGYDVSANVTGGALYLDGTRIAAPTSQKLSGGYQLIEIQTTDLTTADLFAADRGFTERAGGQRLAEVIVYDRLLTESERRQTEAYLSKKWFAKVVAPAASLGTVAVSDGTGLGASSGMPVRVNRLEGVGTVVKSGSDMLTLTDTTAFTGTVDVTAGTLNLAVPAAPLAPPTNTLFWVDASKAGSIDTDSSGSVQTWRDATGNGRYATALSGHVPTLRSGDFAGRPVVDLGPYGSASSCGSMLWSQRITGMKTIIWVLGSQTSGGYLLGATNAAPFHRGPPPEGGEITVATFSHRNYMFGWDAAVPSTAYTNGVSVSTTTTGLSGGYQILFMTWNSGTYADGFALDRNIGDRFGGQRLAEFIAYDRVLTDVERLATDAYLSQKWFGQATAGYSRPETQTGVILREGAVLSMNGSEQSVTSLSGVGIVSNGTLVVNGTLSPGFATGHCAALSVTGGLTLGDGVTFEVDCTRSACDVVTVSGALTVAGGGSVTVRLPEPPGLGWAGRSAVMTFGSITEASNLSSWTVSGLPAGYTGGLVVDGTTVYLEIRAKGTLLLVH